MAAFRYIGEAPNGSIELYGVTFKPGEASEVSDAFAIRKLSANRFFEAVWAAPQPVAAEEPKRKGRRPKDEPVNGDVPEV